MKMNRILRTTIPGPKSIALMNARNEAVAIGPYHVTPIFVEKAADSLLIDVDGNQFIDFASGLSTMNCGHSNSKVQQAISNQLSNHLHLSFNVTPYESYVKVCEKLNAITPGKFKKKSFLCNSGAEAVENAVKLARAFTKKQAIISFDHGFHGRTYMAMSLTSQGSYKNGFAPFNPEVYRVPFPDSKPGEEDFGQKSFDHLEYLVHTQMSADNVAAIIFEPILGEGGFLPFPQKYLVKLSEFCQKYNIVLIADEIQTGFGRTGTSFFACDHYGISPDIIITGKCLGGGLPLSAVTGKTEIMDCVGKGGIGGTFGGNPLSCVAALAMFEEVSENLSNGKKLGKTLWDSFLRLKQDMPTVIANLHGLDLMLGVELKTNSISKIPSNTAVKQVIEYSYKNGLVVMSAGTYGNILRIMPSLKMNQDTLLEGIHVIENGLRSLSENKM